MRVEFDIDELVLEGVDLRDRHRIADELRSELTARLQTLDPRRLAAAPPRVGHLQAPDTPPTLQQHQWTRSVGIGRAVASSLAASIMPVGDDVRTRRMQPQSPES